MFKPSMTVFDAAWENPEQFIVDEQDTIITQQGIIDFYTYIARCAETKTIPAHCGVGSFDLFGSSVPKKDNKIQKYYDFEGADTTSWDKWIEDCGIIAAEGE